MSEQPIDPTVDDEPTSPAPAGDTPTREEVEELKRRLAALEDAATAPDEDGPADPAPSGPTALYGKVVEFDGHDQWGNPRRIVGVVLGPHLIEEDRLDVCILPTDLQHAYDAEDLRPLGS